VTSQPLDAVEGGRPEVLADEVSHRVRGGLAGGVRTLYPQLGD
jgi:hypothetical protein